MNKFLRYTEFVAEGKKNTGSEEIALAFKYGENAYKAGEPRDHEKDKDFENLAVDARTPFSGLLRAWRKGYDIARTEDGATTWPGKK